VTLLWRALAPPPVDYTVFVHLLDANGSLVAGNDTQPLGGRYPTTIWSAGEHILDIHNLPTPADLPPGQYQLAIGLYQQTTGERLPIDDLDGSEDLQGRLILKPAITLDHK
jgi:hypothetical protein